MPIYSLWRDPDGGLTLVQGTKMPTFSDGYDQAKDSMMIRMIEAESWEQALKVMYQYQDTYGKGST